MGKRTTLKFKEPKLEQLKKGASDLFIYTIEDPTGPWDYYDADSKEYIQFMNEQVIQNVEVDVIGCYGTTHINNLIKYLEQLKSEALRVYGSDNIIIRGNTTDDDFEFTCGIIAQETPQLYNKRLEFLRKAREDEERRRIEALAHKEKSKKETIERIKREAKELGLQVIG